MAELGPGRHRVKITNTRLGESRSGKDYIGMAFEDAEGNSISADRWLTEKTVDRTISELKTCGWDAEANGYDFTQLNASPSPIEGNEVEIQVKEEAYNGTMQNRVAWINPIGGPKARPDRAAKIAERMKARALKQPVPVEELPEGEARMPEEVNGGVDEVFTKDELGEDCPF